MIAPVMFRKTQINADLLFCFSDEKQPWSTPAVALIDAGILLPVLLIGEVPAALNAQPVRRLLRIICANTRSQPASCFQSNSKPRPSDDGVAPKSSQIFVRPPIAFRGRRNRRITGLVLRRCATGSVPQACTAHAKRSACSAPAGSTMSPCPQRRGPTRFAPPFWLVALTPGPPTLPAAPG